MRSSHVSSPIFTSSTLADVISSSLASPRLAQQRPVTDQSSVHGYFHKVELILALPPPPLPLNSWAAREIFSSTDVKGFQLLQQHIFTYLHTNRLIAISCYVDPLLWIRATASQNTTAENSPASKHQLVIWFRPLHNTSHPISYEYSSCMYSPVDGHRLDQMALPFQPHLPICGQKMWYLIPQENHLSTSPLPSPQSTFCLSRSFILG